ncbi:hypothetical protein CVT26_001435 [Gymnopilus dilepis]|uniref:Uncharacterized protein n=1 Tax=Gymnopilus dilepis TaxID=231916 RepID=A0A409W7C1_9AGAR|nr:hypothetical protein CVT26_001435 [Gymnopilus dilepis]
MAIDHRRLQSDADVFDHVHLNNTHPVWRSIEGKEKLPKSAACRRGIAPLTHVKLDRLTDHLARLPVLLLHSTYHWVHHTS